MARPAVKVEIAFNAGYSTPAASRTWTDVTAYTQIVDGIDITHGRGDERSQADANSLRLVLNNKDGRFTPGLASSPYYPNVKIGRPVRVTSTPSGGSASVRYDGYIDEWPLEWPLVVGTYATSTITATSRIARLGASAPLGNYIYEEYKLDTPAAHFMLDNLADSVVGGVSLAQTGTGAAVTFGGTGPGTDGIQAATFAANGKFLLGTHPGVTDVGFTVECFFNSTESSFAAQATVGPVAIQLVNGKVRGRSEGTAQLDSANNYNDGETHHAAVTYAVSGGTETIELFVDGLSEGSDTGTPPELFWAGMSVGITLTATMVVSHVGVFDTVLSDTRILAHADAGLTGSAGETAEARLQHYAALASIPTAEQDISTAADTPIAHIDTTGQTPLALMQAVEQTDGGVLYDSRDGLLSYAARTERYNAAAAVTLDVDASQVEASYAPKLDRSSIINEVIATIADGSDPQETIRAVDQTSYDDYGPHRLDIELATTDENEAHAAAWFRVNTYGEPRARAPQLGVEIAHLSTALQAQVLALNVGSKIDVTNLPSQSDESSKSFFVEGYTERITPEAHHFDFNISPSTGFDVWELAVAGMSELGTTTRIAY